MPDSLKTVVISGGTKGLGRALSLAFGGKGYRVLALYAHDASSAESLTREFGANKIEGTCLKLDITQPFDLPPIESGPLVLVNNACAPFEPKPFHTVGWSEVESQWQVSVKGSFLLTNAVLRRMVQDKGGTIVNILSEAVANPPKGFGSYVTVKSALAGMTKALAVEYRPRGVRVFSISPGFMLTSLTEGWDVRLRHAATGKEPFLPENVAKFVLQKVEGPETAGDGEDYSLS